ncbi:secretory phospholipase A2 receptor-like [Ostrinia nubilalis]|uniref:secretory phospholipase A2 receptor-like n=1 Tax=Ostrinia nubilalis TaxID=29057 RepID=UPI0030822CBA
MSSLLLILFAAGLSSVTSRHVNFYRRDYTYVDEFDAFYKFHWDINGSDWGSTFVACDNEGAELFYPRARDEWTVVKKLIAATPLASNVSEIFVGIHDKFGVGEFLTINGFPTSAPILNIESSDEGKCVTLDIDSGAYLANDCIAEPGTTRPFVCKKVEDVSCPTIDKGYQYFKETRKCYKMNNKAMNWSKAMETCFMEGGMLVVIESELEAQIIREKITYVNRDQSYYSGFKQILGNQEYYTVKGHKLSDTGYDNFFERKMAPCGTLFDYGNNGRIYLDSADCNEELPFICEIGV